MQICKNCSNTFNGKYCDACGQKFIQKQTFRTFFSGLFEAFNLNNKVVNTTIGIFFKPFKLASEFEQGNTKKYFGPFTTLIAVVSLSYIISETKILGFNVAGSETEFEVILGFVWPALLTSIIVALLPFTAFGWIRLTTLSVYSFSGMYALWLLGSIISGYEWIHQFSGFIAKWMEFIPLVYLLYFFIASFKGYYGTLIAYLIVWFALMIFQINLNEEQKQHDALNRLYFRDNPPPRWSRVEYPSHWYSSNILSDSSYFAVDINEDVIRDITIFMRDSLDNNYMLVADIRENKGKSLNINELLSVENNKGIVSVQVGSKEGEKFNIQFNDGSNYGIFFNGKHYYGKRIESDR